MSFHFNGNRCEWYDKVSVNADSVAIMWICVWFVLDIPILPTVTAKITFQEFAFRNDIKAELFEIPSRYIEDPTR